MMTNRLSISVLIAAAATLLIAGSATAALDSKDQKQLNECRYAAGDVGRVAKDIRGRIESSAQKSSKPYQQCQQASAALEDAADELYFAITHSDYDKLPDKAAGKKTRKAKDDLDKAYKTFSSACSGIAKKEAKPELKKLLAGYKKTGKQCNGVSTIMGK